MVAVLFAMKDSIYYELPDVDVYDKDRDALSYDGKYPVVAHPPCRAWSRMRGLAKPPEGERELAIWAVNLVRQNGGVLEHPHASALWKEPNVNLPKPGKIDEFGGYTLDVNQFWWGHKATKRTWIYVCGAPISAIPPIQLRFEAVTHVVSTVKRKAIRRPEVSKKERSATPVEFAKFLIQIAELCQKNTQ